MRVLQVELDGRGYPIMIGPGLLAQPEQYREFATRPRRILTDATVAGLHLEALRGALQLAPDHVMVVPAGESSKTWEGVEQVLEWLLAARFPRDGVLIALGGGVIGDLAGFAAAIYQRGVDFIQVPTTLLAQVDSSVGGKTGVNHRLGKNLIGAFHQPRLVVADTETLRTLPARELSAGLAEVIKYGMLADASLFTWLERHVERLRALEADALSEAIDRCCAIKARVVGMDERESGPRALLNLGHTFGHAIETYTGYGPWLHGEAVAVGLVLAACLSREIGWIGEAEVARCQALIRRAGLPVEPPAGMRAADFRELMMRDKKVLAGQLRLVLLRHLGNATITASFDAAALDRVLDASCAQAA